MLRAIVNVWSAQLGGCASIRLASAAVSLASLGRRAQCKMRLQLDRSTPEGQLQRLLLQDQAALQPQQQTLGSQRGLLHLEMLLLRLRQRLVNDADCSGSEQSVVGEESPFPATIDKSSLCNMNELKAT